MNILLTMLALLACITVVPAEIVLTNADCDLVQAALDQGGIIRLQFDGNIKLSQTFTNRKDSVLDGTGHSVTFDGGGQVRHFYNHTNATLTLQHLILTNAYVLETNQIVVAGGGVGSSRGYGGSILNAGGTVRIIECAFGYNRVHASGPLAGCMCFGGDISNHGGSLGITNSSFRQSMASCFPPNVRPSLFGFGGSIFSEGGTLSVCGGEFVGCTLQTAQQPGAGGAIAALGSRTRLEHVNFVQNGCGAYPPSAFADFYQAGQGGALYNTQGLMEVIDCRFDSNILEGKFVYGGAIYNNGVLEVRDSSFLRHNNVRPYFRFGGPNLMGGAIHNAGNASFSSCIFQENSVRPMYSNSLDFGLGGGIYSTNNLSVSGCVFHTNSASGGPGANGGAIYIAKGSAKVEFSTFSDNQVVLGSSLIQGASIAVASGEIASLRANIFASSQRAPRFRQLDGEVLDNGFNLSTDQASQLTSSNSLHNTDPKLGAFGDYGGALPCIPLLADSPAIDLLKDGIFPSSDVRGFPRPLGAGTDIGAFEFQPPSALVARRGEKMEIFIPSGPGQTIALQTSSNLTSWQMFNVAMTNLNGLTRVKVAPEAPIRFFRAILP